MVIQVVKVTFAVHSMFNSANIYCSNSTTETLEGDVKYAQNLLQFLSINASKCSYAVRRNKLGLIKASLVTLKVKEYKLYASMFGANKSRGVPWEGGGGVLWVRTTTPFA